MRIVFFGFQTWGRKTLQALIDQHHDVPLVITHPASAQSYKAIWSDSVEQLARQHDIPVHLTDRVDAETIDLVKRAEADVIVVNSWYTRMPAELYELPPHGTLNFHDSMLPRFTGFSPVLWALISGETEIGLTVHRMDEGLDTGDILVQKSISVGPRDTATDLVTRTIDLIPDVLATALSALESGTATWTPQDKSARTYFHKRSEQDSKIDWHWDATDLERFVRALSDPYPRAFADYRGERIEILTAHISDARYGGTVGRVIVQEGGGAVVCGPDPVRGRNHALVITEVRTSDGAVHRGETFFARGGYLR